MFFYFEKGLCIVLITPTLNKRKKNCHTNNLLQRQRIQKHPPFSSVSPWQPKTVKEWHKDALLFSHQTIPQVIVFKNYHK